MDKETIKEVFAQIRGISWALDNDSSANIEWILQGIEHTLVYTESPMEKKFMLAMLGEIIEKKDFENHLWNNPIVIWTNEILDLYPEDYAGKDKSIVIFINPNIEKYRPDILITNAKKKIIFEIDGFEFHNTKAQLVKDKKRERELNKMDCKVYRFSGTEIHQDERKVAREALEIIYKEFNLKSK